MLWYQQNLSLFFNTSKFVSVLKISKVYPYFSDHQIHPYPRIGEIHFMLESMKFTILRIRSEPQLCIPVCDIPHLKDRLGGLVAKASTSRVVGPGFESRLRQDFSGSSHTSDFKIGTPVATLPGAWRYRVIAGTGRPGVSIQCDWVRQKVWSAISVSVWQHVKLFEQICPWDNSHVAGMLRKQPTNSPDLKMGMAAESWRRWYLVLKHDPSLQKAVLLEQRLFMLIVCVCVCVCVCACVCVCVWERERWRQS